eukprot:gene1388-811_t
MILYCLLCAGFVADAGILWVTMCIKIGGCCYLLSAVELFGERPCRIILTDIYIYSIYPYYYFFLFRDERR